MNIYALIPLISVISYIALIGFVLTRPLARVHKVFIFYLSVSMLWSFNSFVIHADFFPTQTLWWNRILIILGASIPVVFYHFVRVFFNKATGKGTYLGYALLTAFAIFISQGGILKSSYVIDGILYHELDASLYLLTILLTVFIVLAIFHLIQGFRQATNPRQRNRIGYLLAAISMWILFVVTNFVPSLANYSIDHIGNIANALIISYAILRFHLLDIRLVVRRALAYFVLTIALSGVYIGVILLGHRLAPEQPLYMILLLGSGLVLLMALLTRPLMYVIQVTVDRLFYREAYEYRQILLSFSSKMGNILNLNELASEMLSAITRAMHLTQVRLLLEDNDSGDFTPQFTYPEVEDEPSAELRFSADSAIVTWLKKEANPLSLEQINNIPELKALWQTEKESLITSNLEFLFPIKSRGKLIGILALGIKQSNALYSHDDIELVMSLASQAGIMIENARILDILKNQQHRVERLLNQVVLAQEEERKRISIDLHDSVAQWLVAASYSAQTCSQLLSGNGNVVALKELAAMESTITKSLKELRRVVIGLRPPALDELGLTHALRQSLNDLKIEGLRCRFSEMGIPLRLPSSTEIAVYRVVQEALSNIRKHAEATKVSIRLLFLKDKLSVEIRDDGKGFNLSQTLNSAISVGHVGLLGMKQRAEMLGGEIKIRTGEGTGTTIILSLPIQPQAEER